MQHSKERDHREKTENLVITIETLIFIISIIEVIIVTLTKSELIISVSMFYAIIPCGAAFISLAVSTTKNKNTNTEIIDDKETYVGTTNEIKQQLEKWSKYNIVIGFAAFIAAFIRFYLMNQ